MRKASKKMTKVKNLKDQKTKGKNDNEVTEGFRNFGRGWKYFPDKERDHGNSHKEKKRIVGKMKIKAALWNEEFLEIFKKASQAEKCSAVRIFIDICFNPFLPDKRSCEEGGKREGETWSEQGKGEIAHFPEEGED